MNKRKTITDIGSRSRKTVHSRDGLRCVYCGRTDKPIELAHYISRSHGGKGVPENLVSLCADCHRQFDGTGRNKMHGYIVDYLKSHYPDWNEQDQIFRKWEQGEC